MNISAACLVVTNNTSGSAAGTSDAGTAVDLCLRFDMDSTCIASAIHCEHHRLCEVLLVVERPISRRPLARWVRVAASGARTRFTYLTFAIIGEMNWLSADAGLSRLVFCYPIWSAGS